MAVETADNKSLRTETIHTENFPDNSATSPDQIDNEDLGREFKWNLDVVSNLGALYLLVFAMVWAQVVPPSSIAFIARKFPTEVGNASWIATAPTLILTATSAVIGDLSDIFGRRWFLLCSCTLGCAGMLVAGRANSLLTVIGGQVLNGPAQGGGFLSNHLLQEIVPRRYRPWGVAGSTFCSSFSFIGSPIIQGVLIQEGVGGVLDGWRIGLYLGAGLWALAGATLFLLYHPGDRPNPENLPVPQRLAKLDFVGIFLVVGGLTLFMVGINYGDNPISFLLGIRSWTYDLRSSTSYLLRFVGVDGNVDRCFPHALFHERNYSITLLVRVVGGMALYGGQAYLPQVCVYVFGLGGLRISVYQLPFSIATVWGAFASMGLLMIWKEVKLLVIALMLIMGLGAGLVNLVKEDSNFVVWFFPSLFMGLGIGGEASLLSVVASLATLDHLIATAVCVSTAFGSLGGIIALTMYNQISSSKIRTIVPAKLSEAALEGGIPVATVPAFLGAYLSSNATALREIPEVTESLLASTTKASRQGYADSFRYIWYVLIAWLGVSLIASVFFTSTKKYMTSVVAAPVKEGKHHKSHDQGEKSV
ncbi:major facilitator superfamily domain-containing protein [Leptodontidium sp. 2 PMI_412]|nr:major facilitator superfamily domain-containing protein [Leptodontidium sp. 2 PMI_412]